MSEPIEKPNYAVEENADGSLVIKLKRPVKFQGDSLARVTIPALTGRHMRGALWVPHRLPNVGELVAFAGTIVEPLGVVDELPAQVARDLGIEVMLLLGKSLGIGEEPSPT